MTRSYKTKLHVANDAQNDFLVLCMAVKRKLYNLYRSVQFGLLETRKRLYPDYEAFKERLKKHGTSFTSLQRNLKKCSITLSGSAVLTPPGGIKPRKRLESKPFAMPNELSRTISRA